MPEFPLRLVPPAAHPPPNESLTELAARVRALPQEHFDALRLYFAATLIAMREPPAADAAGRPTEPDAA
jgi:hypothetical protein